MRSAVPTTESKDRAKYKVKNWKQYNKSLQQRGSLSLWLEDSVFDAWGKVDVNKKVVGEQTYPDCVIYCAQVLRIQHRQPLRQGTGFIASLLALMNKRHLPVPDYSTLCRRQSRLPVKVTARWERGENIAIAIDSTGLKVYGEGEWKVRKHGASKHRTWRKLHIGIDVESGEIISVELTTNAEDDAPVGARMLAGKTQQLKSCGGDGAYDDFVFREVLGEGVTQIIPPPKNAVIRKGTKKKPLPAYLGQRNEAVAAIERIGRQEWKIISGYHLRSRSEATMYRYKTVFGGTLNARDTGNEKAEVKLKCAMLNRYRTLGMPLSVKAA